MNVTCFNLSSQFAIDAITDDTPKVVQLLNSLECPEAHLLFGLLIALHSFSFMEAFPGLQGGRGYCRSLLPCMLRTRSGGLPVQGGAHMPSSVVRLKDLFRLKEGILFTDTSSVVRLKSAIFQFSMFFRSPRCWCDQHAKRHFWS